MREMFPPNNNNLHHNPNGFEIKCHNNFVCKFIMSKLHILSLRFFFSLLFNILEVFPKFAKIANIHIEN